MPTFNALGNGQQDACDESLAVMRLLEDCDLLAKPGAVGVHQEVRNKTD